MLLLAWRLGLRVGAMQPLRREPLRWPAAERRLTPTPTGACGDASVPQVIPLSSAREHHFSLRHAESPMGAAEMISCEEARASKPWDALRRQLPARFNPWLDGLEAQ